MYGIESMSLSETQRSSRSSSVLGTRGRHLGKILKVRVIVLELPVVPVDKQGDQGRRRPYEE